MFQALEPTRINDVQIAIDDAPPRSVPDWQPFAELFEAGSVLWLIDVSDPARAALLAQQRALLNGWLDRVILRHKLGVAAFLDVIDLGAPIGSDVTGVRKAIQSLTTRERDAAPYGSIVSGIRYLTTVPAERRSLWVFTSSVAADPGYRLDKVIREAQTAGVAVIVLAFPTNAAQPDFRYLQQLARETHGYFVSADAQGRLPPNTLDNILALVDSGGRFTLGLPNIHGTHRLTVSLIAENGASYREVVPLHGQQASVSAPAGRPAGLIWMVFGLGGIASVCVLWRAFTRRRLLATATAVRLIPLGGVMGAGQVFIQKFPFRIGRLSDNDLCLSNDSVSGHHAELRRLAGGVYRVVDLGSTNGLRVNGEQVEERILSHGDVMTLGEVKLRFLRGV